MVLIKPREVSLQRDFKKFYKYIVKMREYDEVIPRVWENEEVRGREKRLEMVGEIERKKNEREIGKDRAR
jgi:hypothetical protein